MTREPPYLRHPGESRDPLFGKQNINDFIGCTIGRRPKKGGATYKSSVNYVSIDDRPEGVAGRRTYGPWEADLMAFWQNKDVILVAHERKSCMKFAWRQRNKGAEAVSLRLCEHLQACEKV